MCGSRTGVSGFDPRREEPSLISLVPQVLVQISVCYLLKGLHIVHRHQVRVQVHELNTDLHIITLVGTVGGNVAILLPRVISFII